MTITTYDAVDDIIDYNNEDSDDEFNEKKWKVYK